MKAVADTLAVARSKLIERVTRPVKSRDRKARDEELLALIRRMVDGPPDLRLPAHQAAGEPATQGRRKANDQLPSGC